METVERPWTQSAEAVVATLGSHATQGLSQEEADSRLAKCGRNELPVPEPTAFLTLVLKQFEDLMVLILLGAAVVSFLLALTEDAEDRLAAFFEPAVILLILIANAIVGVMQESNAEKSLEALRRNQSRDSHVTRGGVVKIINAGLLVPGDVITVNVGDKVPADCRLLRIDTATLNVDESLLTGESEASSKSVAVVADADAVRGDQKNCLFAGTLVDRGQAVGVVTATGALTGMGEISQSLADEEDEKTPLQMKLDEFGEQLSWVILIICIVVWLINIHHFTDPAHGGIFKGAIYYFKIAVALAVAAIPEGLPAVVTVCLALGTRRMAAKNAIVRSLPSVETLGCTSVICSDKTGTLTTNMMSAQRVYTVASADKSGAVTFDDFCISGDSFAPYGEVTRGDTGDKLRLPACDNESLADISKIASLCNESNILYEVDSKTGEGRYSKSGTATEAALRVLSEKLSVPDEKEADAAFSSNNPVVRTQAAATFWKSQYERQHLLEFSHVRKSMSVHVTSAEGAELLVKGAPEGLLDRCTHVKVAGGKVQKLSASSRASILEHVESVAERGLRCLSFAYVNNPNEDQDWASLDAYASIESGLTFVGLACLLDPPRPEVKASIEKCRRAGVRVIVITGDNIATAEAICRRIGVFAEGESTEGLSFVGSAFAKMSEEEQSNALNTARLFARVEPVHKQIIVNILKKNGEIVAMTGDGVNDAPALKAAHIGVAMGSGTDVAREASDMVLQDDNFATIVMAVEEGRSIYTNTKQFIRYLISSNIGEVACIFFTAAIGMPEALIPVQLLWVNLVTDGLPATALGFNPPDVDVMERGPRDRSDGIINGWMFFRYMAIGIYVGVATVAGFIYWYLIAEAGPHISYAQLTGFHDCAAQAVAGGALFPKDFDCSTFNDARPSTISLSILVIIEMLNALNALSENQSLLVVWPTSNIWVCLAILLSLGLHMVILYVQWFNEIFHVIALNKEEWIIVWACSVPVILLDEVLKLATRVFVDSSNKKAVDKKNQ